MTALWLLILGASLGVLLRVLWNVRETLVRKPLPAPDPQDQLIGVLVERYVSGHMDVQEFEDAVAHTLVGQPPPWLGFGTRPGITMAQAARALHAMLTVNEHRDQGGLPP